MHLFVMKAEFITMLIIGSRFGMWNCIVCKVGTTASNEHAASCFTVQAGRSSFVWKPKYVIHILDGFQLKV